jgi:hypothetical protein
MSRKVLRRRAMELGATVVPPPYGDVRVTFRGGATVLEFEEIFEYFDCPNIADGSS